MLRKQSSEEQRKRIQIAARRNIFDIELKLYHSNSFGFVGDQFQCFYGHSHEALEVLAVEEGELTFEIGDRQYHTVPGDVVIVNPYESHTAWFPVKQNRAAYKIILFDTRFFIPVSQCELGDRIGKMIDGTVRLDEFFAADTPAAKEIHEIGDRLIPADKNQALLTNNCALMIGAYQLLDVLFAGHEHTPAPTASRRSQEFILAVQQLVAERYTTDISTADAAQAMGYNLTSFCHLFKQNFGTSFVSYLNEWRIYRAVTDYQEAPRPVAEIAAAVGFTDPGYFWRVFKRQMGVTPREYFSGK